MKKITRRALSVLLIAALVICGMTVYILRYVDDGQDWALYFSRSNSTSGGEIIDRNGTVLASFNSTTSAYAADENTRIACYHITGDYWNRTGTGALSAFWDSMQGYSLFTGTTKTEFKSLALNVDAGLCRTAYNAIGSERKGAALMMNYKTGELLVMVSAPSLDPVDGEAEIPDGAFINRCISASFAPGSVFKLVTSAAAIETVPDMFSRTFYCEGVYTIAGVDIKCTGEHYTQTFEQALANSCNCAFARISVKVGQENMKTYAKQFGFLDNHSLDGITTAAGSYPQDFVGDPELAWSGIGQSTDLVCPFSLLRYVAAIANDGVICEPKLLADGKAAEQNRIINEDTARTLKSMMSYNVSSHYGPETNFPGISYLCAKTGTAELGDGTSHAWFAGFLDDESNPYAFAVLIERGGGGLSQAGPVAYAMLKEAIK